MHHCKENQGRKFPEFELSAKNSRNTLFPYQNILFKLCKGPLKLKPLKKSLKFVIQEQRSGHPKKNAHFQLLSLQTQFFFEHMLITSLTKLGELGSELVHNCVLQSKTGIQVNSNFKKMLFHQGSTKKNFKSGQPIAENSFIK